MLFGEAEEVPAEIEMLQALGVGASQNAKQRGIPVEETTLGGHARDSVYGVLHKVPVTGFGHPQRFMSARVFVAQALFRHGPRQSNGEPREMILENVVVDALFDAFDRYFLAQRSRDQQKRDVLSGAS